MASRESLKSKHLEVTVILWIPFKPQLENSTAVTGYFAPIFCNPSSMSQNLPQGYLEKRAAQPHQFYLKSRGTKQEHQPVG